MKPDDFQFDAPYPVSPNETAIQRIYRLAMNALASEGQSDRIVLHNIAESAAKLSETEETARGTMTDRVNDIRAQLEGVTPGPWFVWDGVSYMGGGRDLCIGAGATWLANMDHPTCVRRDQHMDACACEPESDASICSLDGDITAEQGSNANFIARARENIPFLLNTIDYLRGLLKESYEENDRLRYPEMYADRAPSSEGTES